MLLTSDMYATLRSVTYVFMLCCLAVLLLGDLFGMAVTLLEVFCIEPDTPTEANLYYGTHCQHTEFWAIVLLPPFAVLAAPLGGLLAVTLQTPSAMRSVRGVARVLWLACVHLTR